MNKFITLNINYLFLLGGMLLLFLGLAPIVSKKYFSDVYERQWKDKRWPFSKNDSYLFNRYIRQITPIGAGISLVILALYRLFFN